MCPAGHMVSGDDLCLFCFLRFSNERLSCLIMMEMVARIIIATNRYIFLRLSSIVTKDMELAFVDLIMNIVIDMLQTGQRLFQYNNVIIADLINSKT